MLECWEVDWSDWPHIDWELEWVLWYLVMIMVMTIMVKMRVRVTMRKMTKWWRWW